MPVQAIYRIESSSGITLGYRSTRSAYACCEIRMLSCYPLSLVEEVCTMMTVLIAELVINTQIVGIIILLQWFYFHSDFYFLLLT